MDQAYKDIARKLCLPGWDDPNVDTFQLISEWLSDDVHGPWLLILDNADDMEVFFSPKPNPSSVGSEQTAPLVNYLPRSSNSSTLITTRDKRVGERLRESNHGLANGWTRSGKIVMVESGAGRQFGQDQIQRTS